MSAKTFSWTCVALLTLGIVGACQSTAGERVDTAALKTGPATDAAAVVPDSTAVTPEDNGATGQATAVYQVGPLDAAAIGALNQALGGRDCVLATRPDAEQGRFEVTYRADLCCPGSLKALLAEVRPTITLERSGSAAPTERVDDQGSCGGCPYKNSCDKGGQ